MPRAKEREEERKSVKVVLVGKEFKCGKGKKGITRHMTRIWIPNVQKLEYEPYNTDGGRLVAA